MVKLCTLFWIGASLEELTFCSHFAKMHLFLSLCTFCSQFVGHPSRLATFENYSGGTRIFFLFGSHFTKTTHFAPPLCKNEWKIHLCADNKQNLVSVPTRRCTYVPVCNLMLVATSQKNPLISAS